MHYPCTSFEVLMPKILAACAARLGFEGFPRLILRSRREPLHRGSALPQVRREGGLQVPEAPPEEGRPPGREGAADGRGGRRLGGGPGRSARDEADAAGGGERPAPAAPDR